MLTNTSKENLKSIKALRDFEELNGLSQSVQRRGEGSEIGDLI